MTREDEIFLSKHPTAEKNYGKFCEGVFASPLETFLHGEMWDAVSSGSMSKGKKAPWNIT